MRFSSSEKQDWQQTNKEWVPHEAKKEQTIKKYSNLEK